MKISLNWLQTLVNIGALEQSLVGDTLTQCGLEIESITPFESVQGMLKGVVVGHVTEKSKHPDADRLSITKVDVGEAAFLQIVCGAPNVEVGQKVLVARVGTSLHSVTGATVEIKKSKIRGTWSEGMICAEDELGIGKNHDGILVLEPNATIGQNASQYFHLYEDTILEIGLTPNRGDAASHYGVAIDLAAALNCKSKLNSVTNGINLPHYEAQLPKIQLPNPSKELKLPKLNIHNPELCPQYNGMVIAGIRVGPSPTWLINYLTCIGQRPINNIVDVTNFVMFETGQPLHAFDARSFDKGSVHVRPGNAGESLLTLDGIERKIDNTNLVIANETQPLCLAGIMGGKNYGVANDTTSIFLESATFSAVSVRHTGKMQGIKTDSSFRFERGTDAGLAKYALQRACALLLEIGAATHYSEISEFRSETLQKNKITFRYEKCEKVCGFTIEKNAIRSILKDLDFQFVSENEKEILLEVPFRKTDVTREIDAIEEVLRIYGMNAIPDSKKVQFHFPENKSDKKQKIYNIIDQLLPALGFSEIMSTSLTKDHYYAENKLVIKMLHPLSADLSVLRNSLLAGLLEAAIFNVKRKNEDLKLYEKGRIYERSVKSGESFQESEMLGMLLTGKRQDSDPYQKDVQSSFFSMKSYVEAVLMRVGIGFKTQEQLDHPEMSPCLNYIVNDLCIGSIGGIRKNILEKFDLHQEAFFAQIEIQKIIKSSFSAVKYKEPGKFPQVERDLTLLMNLDVKFEQLKEIAEQCERKLLKDVRLCDVYQGEKIPAGKKSYSLKFTLEDEETTLTDKKVESVMGKILDHFTNQLQAELRQF